MQKSLASLQLMRFIAAVAVVVCHSLGIYNHVGGDNELFRGIVRYGELGVPVFFVISGFVIFGAAQRAPDAADFFRRRLGRIYPPLWAAVGLLLLIHWSFGSTPPITATMLFHSLTLIDLAPSGDGNALFVAWTLSFEMLFYLAVAALLLLPARFRMATSIALICLLAVTTYGASALVPALFADPLIFSFVFGVAAAWARVPRSAASPLIALAAIFWAVGLSVGAESHGSVGTLLFGGGTALLLAGIKTRDFTGRAASTANALGDTTYALYLTHPLVLLLLEASGWHRQIAAAISPAGLVGIYWIAALALGVAFHLLVERRLLRWRRKAPLGAIRASTVTP